MVDFVEVDFVWDTILKRGTDQLLASLCSILLAITLEVPTGSALAIGDQTLHEVPDLVVEMEVDFVADIQRVSMDVQDLRDLTVFVLLVSTRKVPHERNVL